MDLRRIGIEMVGAIPQYGAVVPACFPKLVDNIHIFVGEIVAIVMGHLAIKANGAGGAVEIARDDVPADAAAVRWSRVDMRRAKRKGCS